MSMNKETYTIKKKRRRWFPFHVTIGTKIAFFLFLVGMLPMVAFGVIYLQNEQATLEKEIANKLALLADSKEAHVSVYFADIAVRTNDFSSDGFIRDQTKKILATRLAKDQQALSTHLIVNKKPLDTTLAGILVLDGDGTVIAATDEKEIGRNESHDAYFIEGKNHTALMRTAAGDVHFGIVSPLAVAVPLTDKDTHAFMGVIVNIFDPQKLESILSESFIAKRKAIESPLSVRPDTLDIYLVDQQKRIIFHPIQRKDAPVAAVADTFPVRECLDGEREIVGTYANYANMEVLGASMCLTDKGIILLAEIDKKEALLPVTQQRTRFYSIIGILAACIIAFSFIVARMLTRPITTLRESVEKVKAGDLHHRADVAKTGDEIEGLGNTFNAMTEALEEHQKLMEEERQKLMVLLENLPVGVFMMKAPEGIVVAANPRSIELLGQEKELVQGGEWSYADMYGIVRATKEDGTPYPENELPITIALREGKMATRDDIVIKRPDGEKVILRLTGVPVKEADGTVLYAIAVFDDVTKEREIDRAKTEFVSLASHQLRTPLSTISWYTEMLLAGDVGTVTSDQKSYLEEIYRGNKRMVGLVNALLNVSRIEMGTFATEIKTIDFSAEIDAALKEFEPMIAEKKMAIIKECAANIPAVHADQKMIRIIFQNLISNAVKYTPPEGHITVRVARDEGNQVRIEVSDTGYGIPKHQYAKMFTKLFRADNIVQRDTEGTGLGLYLVKLVVDQLKGKIWFVSEEKKGTSFFITLPTQ